MFIELESQPFKVTPNLFSALQHLRHPTQKIALWVDAICINQNDVSERTQKVKLMTVIYENAISVLMWLGPEKDASNTAMRFLVDYNNGIREGTSRLALLEHSFDIQVGLIRLLTRQYWSRVWIMQEVIVSRAAYICCGRYVASWEALVDLIAPLSPYDQLQLEMKGHFQGFRAIQHAANDLVWPMAQLNFNRQLCDKITYWEGLQLAPKRRASDPRDYIFSLLGFVREIPVDVSYEITVLELYRSLVENIIKRDKVLDILTMCRNFDPDRRGDQRMTDEISTGHTAGGISSILSLLALTRVNHKNGEEDDEPNKGKCRDEENRENGEWQSEADDPKDGRGVQETGGNTNTDNGRSAEEETQENSDGVGKNISAMNTATEVSHNTSLIESDLALLPSWVPRWDIDEVQSGVQIALDPRRTGSCSASGSRLAEVTFSKSRMLAQGIAVDVVDRQYTIPMEHYMRLIRSDCASASPCSPALRHHATACL